MNKLNPESVKASQVSRRQFITRSSLAVGALALAKSASARQAGSSVTNFPYVGRVLGANDRINFACIGVGGKGKGDTNDVVRCKGNIIALCDVDKRIMDERVQELAGKGVDNPQLFQDYRKMLEKVGKDIDAVTVSTPDHHHGLAAMLAMRMGKHCFCQKPLVQTVYEARAVRQLAREKKLITQMGNQGSAADGLRRAVEVVQAGVIGNPVEIHVWSNRPIWPQGLDRPQGSDPIPETLAWDNWLGPAPTRPFKKGVYHTFKWRGWTDFGTGALGDMACHTVNMPFRACKLGYPNVIECELASRMYSETYPLTSRIRFEFPEREGLPPLKFWWYDGNPSESLQPLRPSSDVTREIITMNDKLPISGALIIGEKGKIFSPDDYGEKFFILTKGQDEYVPGSEHEACKAVPQTIPRAPGSNTTGHMQEWFNAMRGGPDTYSKFEIAGYLAEVILLGCIAQRVGEGMRIEWDGPNMKSTNLPLADKFVRRVPRKGWAI